VPCSVGLVRQVGNFWLRLRDWVSVKRTRKPRAGVAVIAATVLAGCGHAGRHGGGDALLQLNVPDRVAVRVGQVAGLGTVLTDSEGRTLYLFGPDARRSVTCTGPCAGTWPPLVILADGTPSAGRGVAQGDLGTRPDPNSGADVVTYVGYPLYRYAGDLSPGSANGQALFLDGGPWYALTPAGDPITTTPSHVS
jgi:predicted lipoprotein with Yx(FWY)xxD motif